MNSQFTREGTKNTTELFVYHFNSPICPGGAFSREVMVDSQRMTEVLDHRIFPKYDP